MSCAVSPCHLSAAGGLRGMCAGPRTGLEGGSLTLQTLHRVLTKQWMGVKSISTSVSLTREEISTHFFHTGLCEACYIAGNTTDSPMTGRDVSKDKDKATG